MFRRQTDQVYEMLQQVQRQMSNTAEGGSSWSSQASQGSSGLGQPRAEQPWPTPSTLRPTGEYQEPTGYQPAPSQPGQPAPPAGPGMREQTAGYSRGGLSRGLSMPLASVLMLLWILTLAVAYMIGHYQGVSSQAMGGVGFASGEAGERQPGGGDEGGDQDAVIAGAADILILKSVRSVDQATLRRWEAEAASLNEISREYPHLPAYFAVRKPTSGGLQLVFGYVDGRFGVDRSDYTSQTAQLREAKYRDAVWRSID